MEVLFGGHADDREREQAGHRCDREALQRSVQGFRKEYC